MDSAKKSLLRKLAVIFILPLLLAGLAGCIGSDGDDGAAFLRIQGDFVTAYGDNNDGIPDVFQLGVYYQSSPGTYNFQYIAGGYYHSGTYTLTVNEGESGGFMTNGEDGEDSYFSLYCGRSYPTLTVDAGSVAPAGASIAKSAVSAAPLVGATGTQTVTRGRYTLTVKYR